MMLDRQEGQVQSCGYCPSLVRWLTTYIDGHTLCFDAAPLPATYGNTGKGWIIGEFTIAGNRQQAYAPWDRHTHRHRARARQVMQLHECPNLSGRTVA